jgi:hypothetical protein
MVGGSGSLIVLNRHAADDGIFRNETAVQPAGQHGMSVSELAIRTWDLAARPLGAGALAQSLCRAEAPPPSWRRFRRLLARP